MLFHTDHDTHQLVADEEAQLYRFHWSHLPFEGGGPATRVVKRSWSEARRLERRARKAAIRLARSIWPEAYGLRAEIGHNHRGTTVLLDLPGLQRAARWRVATSRTWLLPEDEDAWESLYQPRLTDRFGEREPFR